MWINDNEKNPRKGKGIREENVYMRKMELKRAEYAHCKGVGNSTA